MIECPFSWLLHGTRLLRPWKSKKNFKKANEGHKGQIKGQTVLKLNLHIFLTCMGSFECARPDYATVSKFQDEKGQKGRYCQSNLNIVFVQLFWPKRSACTLFVINISAQDLILIGHIKQKDFKGQKVIKATKYWKIWIKAIK